MHGPPGKLREFTSLILASHCELGNGKTISLKAVMKYSKHPCLYVRTFQSEYHSILSAGN